MDFTLTYDGIPFVSDRSKSVRLTPEEAPVAGRIDPGELPPKKYQPLGTLYDTLNEKLPFQYLSDFVPQPQYLGRNIGAIATHLVPPTNPNATVKVGQLYYPNHASRWAVGRFLATSRQVKAMVGATNGGLNPKTFKMQAVPVGAHDAADSSYTVETPLYMLPPRPLAEMGGDFDGLFLVTLVDERYKWQYKPATLAGTITQNTTWGELVTTLGTALGVSVTAGSIEDAFTKPEKDSQLWANAENAATLLDAVAFNVGKVFVRQLDGTCLLQSTAEAETAVSTNRGAALSVIRTAGGDMFSELTELPAGNLALTRNAVVPATVKVTFPKYVQGDDPVPHLVNPRYGNQRPSAWYEESYGDVYVVDVPILSGGACVSGMTGVGTHTLQDTAKALYSGEVQLAASPLNVSGLTALAMAMAQDYYAGQACSALDEVYPGTYAWEPEGFNDILWTYSANARQASTRVMRSEWNAIIRQYQHATPALDGYTNTPRGIGGPSVAQSWRDSYTLFSGTSQAKTLTADLLSGDYTAALANAHYFPTDQRWRGRVEQEDILFEGTSGGVNVGIVYRGIDGTKQVFHSLGNSVQWLLPNTTYGTNVITLGKGFFGAQGAWQSGGISEYKVQCPLRTVRILDASGRTFNNVDSYSGIVTDYDPSQNSGSQFPQDTLCWVQERNGRPVTSGGYYDGQFGGWSLSGQINPVYLVNDFNSSGASITSGSIQSGSFASGVMIYQSDIGAKVMKDTTAISAGTSGPILFDAELWDTHDFHTGSEQQMRFSGGGIGKYQVEAVCDAQVTFAGTGTEMPRALYLNICTSGGHIVSGGQICALLSRLSYTEPTATGTENTTVEYDEACLHIGTHINITSLADNLELWAENNTTGDATFNRAVMSFQKDNKAGTVRSGPVGNY